MIKSCDYCLAVFDGWLWSWCLLSNDENDSKTILCSLCASEILYNQHDEDFE